MYTGCHIKGESRIYGGPALSFSFFKETCLILFLLMVELLSINKDLPVTINITFGAITIDIQRQKP